MNAEKLRRIVGKLVETDEKFNLSQEIAELVASLSHLVSQPTAAPYQTQVSERLDALERALVQAEASLTPGELANIEEIRGRRFFTRELSDDIRNLISRNGMTPAVARDEVNSLAQARSNYMQSVQNARNSLTELGVPSDYIEPGTAEIGFQLPRELFHNTFEQLIKELAILNRVIRAFSEVATGSPEQVKVHQISTSDPQFFLGLSPDTIAMLGDCIKWALDVWKSIAEIRKVRAETIKLPSFDEEDVRKLFDDKIEIMVKEEVSRRVEDLVKCSSAAPERQNEQRIDLSWALNTLLTRIERGVTVEIRVIPPEKSAVDDGELAEAAATDATFDRLREIQSDLVMPRVQFPPILKLPPASPPKPGKTKE